MKTLSKDTEARYGSYWRDFERWAATRELTALPASVPTMVHYLAERNLVFEPATIRGRIAAIRLVHDRKGVASPTEDPSFRVSDINDLSATLELARVPGVDLSDLVKGDRRRLIPTAPETIVDLRDRFLLLLLAGLDLTRSDLVALRAEHLRVDGLSLVVHPAGHDHPTALRSRENLLSPVIAAQEWFEAASIRSGAALRPVTKTGRVLDRQLSDFAVAAILRSRAIAAGLNPADHTAMKWRPIPRKHRGTPFGRTRKRRAVTGGGDE